MPKIYPSHAHFSFCDFAIVTVFLLILQIPLWSDYYLGMFYSCITLLDQFELLLNYTVVNKGRIKP